MTCWAKLKLCVAAVLGEQLTLISVHEFTYLLNGQRR